MNLESKRILVVGASGVLGAEITRILSTSGATVLGTARTNESATRIPSEASLRLLVDLENPASISTLAQYLATNEPVDGVLIAAGQVGFGRAEDTLADQALALMRVNHLGPAQLITELLPTLKDREESFVAAITGVVAEKPFMGMSAYCASKTAFSVWLGSMAPELRRHGIKVFEARPGHTETGLATRAIFGEAPRMPEGMTAEFVAGKIVTAISQDQLVLSSNDFSA